MQTICTQSIKKVLQLSDKSSTRVKVSDITEIFDEVLPSHSAAVHNLHSNNDMFIGTRATDNTSRTITSRKKEEMKGVFEIICKLLV